MALVHGFLHSTIFPVPRGLVHLGDFYDVIREDGHCLMDLARLARSAGSRG
jgi:hypothetical protein